MIPILPAIMGHGSARAILIALAVICVGAGGALAQPSDRRAELKESFAQRYPALLKQQNAGRIGETFEGYVEAVLEEHRRDADVRRIMEAENRDREELYELLAAEIRADVDDPERDRITPEIIARRNATRNFEKARPAHFLQVAADVWIQKKDLARHEELLELKEDGKVGETWEGYVEAVRPEVARDQRIRRVIQQETEARGERYETWAELRETSIEKVAREAAKARFEVAGPKEFLKDRDGQWVRKRDR